MKPEGCPFHALTDEAGAITLARFRSAAPGITLQRPARCPWEIDAATLAQVVKGELSSADMPSFEAVRRTIAGVVCRAGLVEFHKQMSDFVRELRAKNLWTEENMAQASEKFISFMIGHYFAGIRGCPAWMSPDDLSRISTVLRLTRLPDKEAKDLSEVVIKNPAITASMILESIVRDGHVVGSEMYDIASTVSLEFLKRELAHIGTFEAMINTYALQIHDAETSIFYNPKTRTHFFNMPASDIFPWIRRTIDTRTWCGAMRIPGREGTKRTLIEDFFLTLAEFYARVTEKN